MNHHVERPGHPAGDRAGHEGLHTDRTWLIPMRHHVAAAILAGDRMPDWAAGFPQPGDRFAVGLVPGTEGHEAQAAAGTHGGADPLWGAWEIRTREGELIGTTGFHGPPVDGSAELGYGLVPEYRGRGLGGEAVGALVAWARAGGALRLTARVDPENDPSLRLLARLGFTPVRSGLTTDGQVELELLLS